MNEDKHLLVKMDDKICTIEISRPKNRNTLTPLVLEQISDIMNRLNRRDDIRVIIIRGTGDKAFCAGYDINEIPTGARNCFANKEHDILEKTFTQVRNYKYPVIAMINGVCVGAGLDLAVNCDFRIAASGIRLGMTPVKLGVTYHPEGLNRFIKLVGVAATKELFLTGKLIDADKAQKIGLVNQVVPFRELEDTTYSLAGEISKNAPISMSAIKYAINQLTESLNLGQKEKRHIDELTQKAFNSYDLLEGKKAFVQKRKPHFKGK